MPIAPLAPAGVAPAAAPAAAPASAPRATFGSALTQRTSPPSSAATAMGRAPAAAPAPTRTLAVLDGIERAQKRLDAVLAAARAGRTFTAQELLALQAEAYRAAQTVDLAAKLVEQGAQSVKSALNAQV
jgi:hypothetical protein